MSKKYFYCPICKKIKPVRSSQKRNSVKYHISYEPEITIIACSRCNVLEMMLRNNQYIPDYFINSAKAVLSFQRKLLPKSILWKNAEVRIFK